MRSFLVGTSLLLTMTMCGIVEWFKEPIKSKKVIYECTCKEKKCSCSCKHGKDKECNEVCCRCTIECCTDQRNECQKHKRSHESCMSSKCKVLEKYSIWDSQSAPDLKVAIACQCKGHCCKKHKEEIPLYKFLLSWSPWALVIATFDSLFISVAEKVSDDEKALNGVKCELLEEETAAGIFYGAIIAVFLEGVLIFAIVQCCRVFRWWEVKSEICGKERTMNKCLLIAAIVVLSIAYIFIGFTFITFDNNWPWICFAKQDEMKGMTGRICFWVRTRVTYLAYLSISLCIFCFVVAFLIVWESSEGMSCKRIKNYCAERYIRSEIHDVRPLINN